MAPVRTKVEGRSVALTFDDGPDVRWTPTLLNELRALGTTATFFVIAGRDPQVLEQVAAEGHEIGYHCGRHVRHSFREHDEVRREVRDDLIWLEHHGIRPTAWRTPWGDLAPWSRLVAAEVGLELWGWSEDTRDWAGRPAGEMLNDLTATVAAGSVVLMHDGIGPGALRDDPVQTIELVAPLVAFCRAEGLDPGPINNSTHQGRTFA